MIGSIILQAGGNITNASSGLNSSMASASGLTGVTFVIVLVAVTAVFVGSSIQRMERVHNLLESFLGSLYYTVVGIASAVLVGVITAPVWYLSQTDGETQALVGYVIGAIGLGYVVFTTLGYVIDRLIVSTWREYKATQDSEEDSEE